MKNIYKILIIIIIFGLGLTSYNYIVSVFNVSHYETEIVFPTTVMNSFSGDVFVLRNEKPIELRSKGNKIIDYFIEDGEKISLGESIANLYESEKDSKNIYNLKNIDDEIKLLTEIKLLKNTKNLTSEVLYNQIIDNLGDVIDLSNKKVLNNLKKEKNDLFISLIKKNLVYGQISGINEKIEELKEKKFTYINSKYSYATFYSDNTGYFCSKLDGYESDLLVDNLLDKDYCDYVDIMKKKPNKFNDNDYLGKVITDFDWYILFKTDKKNIEKLGSAIFVNVSYNNTNLKDIPAVILDIKEDNKNENGVIILRSNYMSRDILKLRKGKAAVSTRSFYGLAVDVNSIRFSDEQRGVFIKEEKEIKFKKVDSLFETEKIVISKIRPLDKDYLQPFDEVIIDGQGLYDGKRIE